MPIHQHFLDIIQLLLRTPLRTAEVTLFNNFSVNYYSQHSDVVLHERCNIICIVCRPIIRRLHINCWTPRRRTWRRCNM